MSPSGGSRFWELHGVTDEFGRLDRAITSGLLCVPGEVELKRDRLVWFHGGGKELDSPPFFTKPPKLVAAGDGLLRDFVSLSIGSSDTILKFAQKWGLLGICRHDLPRTHRSDALDAGSHSSDFCTPRYFKKSDSAFHNSGCLRRFDLHADFKGMSIQGTKPSCASEQRRAAA
jgi:hypothetical protein